MPDSYYCHPMLRAAWIGAFARRLTRSEALGKVRTPRIEAHALRNEAIGWAHDRQVVLAAVTNDGGEFRWASEDLRADREILRIAVRTHPEAVMFRSGTLRTDGQFLAELIRDDSLLWARTFPESSVAAHLLGLADNVEPGSTSHPADLMSEDRHVLLAAIAQRHDYFQSVPHVHSHTFEFVHAAVSANGLALQHVAVPGGNPFGGDDPFGAHAELVHAAGRSRGMALEFAPPSLKADRDVVCAALRQDPKAILHACRSLRSDAAVVAVATEMGCQQRMWGRPDLPSLREA